MERFAITSAKETRSRSHNLDESSHQASVQLDTDAAARLAALLADAYRIRFARGFAAECVRILLADAPVGATTAAATAITQADLLELIKSVDLLRLTPPAGQ